MTQPSIPHNEFWKGRRVLLTGHTGFKGSWLTLWLLKMGAQVWGYALQPETSPSLFKQVDLDQAAIYAKCGLLNQHFGDLQDLQVLKGTVLKAQPEVVIHLAAQSLVRRSYRDPLGTWVTNVQGSLHVLEALKGLQHQCAVVMVTTDKVYDNQNWDYGYRENDRLGGHDPYSASKAAAELAIASWRSSFCGRAVHQTPNLVIATARAGNVIGGGDWAEERIMPDTIRALASGTQICLRNPAATRPWQHVLEPLGGYLRLAELLYRAQDSSTEHESLGIDRLASAFNFGPGLEANRSVQELVEAALQHWSGSWQDCSDPAAPHEASSLHLQIDKAHHQLGWQPRWDFGTTVARTVGWYRAVHEGASPLECCLADLKAYQEQSDHAH
jgi:CDP-glucose 4,6-dehydratase